MALRNPNEILRVKLWKRREWRVDFGVMEWGVICASIPLGCCVVGVVES